MNQITETTKRPTSITIICILGFIGALLSIPIIFLPIAKQIGAWYPPCLAISAVVGLVCMVGLWRMKKWAAYAYAGFFAINQMVMLVMGIWSIASLLIPAVVVFIALKNIPKMS